MLTKETRIMSKFASIWVRKKDDEIKVEMVMNKAQARSLMFILRSAGLLADPELRDRIFEDMKKLSVTVRDMLFIVKELGAKLIMKGVLDDEQPSGDPGPGEGEQDCGGDGPG